MLLAGLQDTIGIVHLMYSLQDSRVCLLYYMHNHRNQNQDDFWDGLWVTIHS